MSKYVRNMTHQEGEIVQLRVRKQVGERFVDRDARVAAAANWQELSHFATMRDGRWNVWSTAIVPVGSAASTSIEDRWKAAKHEPVLRDVPAAAAEMFLRHTGGH